MITFPRLVLISLLATLVAACSAVKIDQREGFRYAGQQQFLDGVVALTPNATDRQWLLQYLGQPSRIVPMPSNEELYVYNLERVAEKSLSVVLFYQNTTQQVTPMLHMIKLKNGIVVSHWTENLAPAVKTSKQDQGPVAAVPPKQDAALTSSPQAQAQAQPQRQAQAQVQIKTQPQPLSAEIEGEPASLELVPED